MLLEWYSEVAFASGCLRHYFPIFAFEWPEFLCCRLGWTMVSSHWRSCQAAVERRCLFVLAYTIRGKCIWMMSKFEGSTYIDYECL